MDNQELLERLHQRNDDPEKKKEHQEFRKYVVFNLNTFVFAIPAEDVREISFDNTIYYVPFLPPYIKGFANRHGQPYTVFDVLLLFKNESLDTGALLILNLPQDQACLLITDVDEIIKVPLEQVHSISSEDEDSKYFLESITLNEQEVFVLNSHRLLERLEMDLDR